MKSTRLSRTKQKQMAAADTAPRRTISFYRYVKIADPAKFRQKLLSFWGSLGCHGRIYVASEGINAQMNVPEVAWEAFDAWVQSQPELSGVPYKYAVEEGSRKSFYKLTVKVRDKIVADGLDDASFDVTQTGAYLTAAEMNAYIDDPDAVIVDMRNNYESEVGRFDGAITPDVETFREELKIAPELLRIHKNKKIALYCTGGIRCEKASAWLKHNGFEDVKHLKGGIIDYAHQVKEQGIENRFKGKNFVFDERGGERISDDVISSCHVCRDVAADTHYDCNNNLCNKLFISCDDCTAKRNGYCSYVCQAIGSLPASVQKRLARTQSAIKRYQKQQAA